MKNTYVTILILVVLLVGGWFFLGAGENVEAPTVAPEDNGSRVVDDALPAPVVPEIRLDAEGNKTTEGEVKEFLISGENYAFTPALITVKKGDKVKITFENVSGFHDLVIDEFGVATAKSQSPMTKVVEFVADKVGDFEYYCSVGSHRALGMVGTLRVE